MSGAPGRVLVVVPTYDEALTLPGTLGRLRAAVPDADVLVVDDASPDGTGDLAEEMAARDAGVHVLHRAGKDGLGAAYVAGFGWALERGYDVVVEMDADGSHLPEQLPRLLAALGERGGDGAVPDLVIGSRWVPGGEVENWPWHREVLSRGGNAYVRLALGLRLGDATAGFRAYRASALRALDLATVASHGYCFQVDMAWRVARAGGGVVEVPITFVERTAGRSKMSRAIVTEALWRVTVWGVRRRAEQLRGLARPRTAARTRVR
ncbi:polyprenol monophosphomannose synthase [Cellulosimicrobium cellulans]|uniref:polyprenol monophosphomannose synthase n=1 Tax=Cellulosimicrobium cellulans TaxID=1710 RepID=UPI0008495B72|nr:polyprenol monophosphomannose synthase [Cellulosimicrobium cellulans]